MKKASILLGTLILIAVVFNSCRKDDIGEQKSGITEGVKTDLLVPLITYETATPISGQYIVVLNDNAVPFQKSKISLEEGQVIISNVVRDIFSKMDTQDKLISRTYAHALKGFVTTLDQNELNQMRKDSRVQYVEQDQFIALKNPGKGRPGGGGSTPPPQTTPWGIIAVGGSANASSSGVKVWVIDSGIDLEHPDLNVDGNRSKSFLSGKQSTNPGDQFGHGTHVAGTIGALNNNIGVIGVAAGVSLISVRVLDRRGSGTMSGVIAGVNHVASNGSEGDVANMSLGGGISTTLDNAVIAAASTGVRFVLAAGNDSRSATSTSPARANGSNVYTISAMDVNNNFASFSNFDNPPIDYCAPGVSVYSTYKGSSYATMSGTSMAAPHVAGILVLGAINSFGTVNADPDNSSDVIAHR